MRVTDIRSHACYWYTLTCVLLIYAHMRVTDIRSHACYWYCSILTMEGMFHPVYAVVICQLRESCCINIIVIIMVYSIHLLVFTLSLSYVYVVGIALFHVDNCTFCCFHVEYNTFCMRMWLANYATINHLNHCVWIWIWWIILWMSWSHRGPRDTR